MKKVILKKMMAAALAVAIAVLTVPLTAKPVSALTLSVAPEKDWTGYTPVSSLMDLYNIRNDPYGKYYLTCDITFDDSRSPLWNIIEQYLGWIPIGEGYKSPHIFTLDRCFQGAPR